VIRSCECRRGTRASDDYGRPHPPRPKVLIGRPRIRAGDLCSARRSEHRCYGLNRSVLTGLSVFDGAPNQDQAGTKDLPASQRVATSRNRKIRSCGECARARRFGVRVHLYKNGDPRARAYRRTTGSCGSREVATSLSRRQVLRACRSWFGAPSKLKVRFRTRTVRRNTGARYGAHCIGPRLESWSADRTMTRRMRSAISSEAPSRARHSHEADHCSGVCFDQERRQPTKHVNAGLAHAIATES